MAPVPIGKRDKGPPSFIVLQGTISYGAFIQGGGRISGITVHRRNLGGIIDPRDTIHQEGITAVALIPSRSDRFIPRQIGLLSDPLLCPISCGKNHAGTSVLRVSLRTVKHRTRWSPTTSNCCFTRSWLFTSPCTKVHDSS